MHAEPGLRNRAALKSVLPSHRLAFATRGWNAYGIFLFVVLRGPFKTGVRAVCTSQR